MANATAPSCGLHVEKHHTGAGYALVQDGSVLEAGPWLRLRRQAEAMLAELAAAGGDFTLSGGQLRNSPQAGAIGIVLHKWVLRQRHCCEGGEHYSPHTYAMGGRCIGPLSNGQPRRS